MATRLLPPTGAQERDVAIAINQALKGKINSTSTASDLVTLTDNDTTTTLTNALISADSHITFSPRTANAAAEIGAGGMYWVAGDGSVVITHANNAQTDRTFSYAILG